MPEYIPDALTCFNHKHPTCVQYSPHQHTPIVYGAAVQFAKDDDNEPEASKEEKLSVQQVLGTFLYYARAVDSTMLIALSVLAAKQARPTQKTCSKSGNFSTTLPPTNNAILTYRVSDMVFAVHSDVSYLSESKAWKRAGGHFFMSVDVKFPPTTVPC